MDEVNQLMVKTVSSWSKLTDTCLFSTALSFLRLDMKNCSALGTVLGFILCRTGAQVVGDH